LDLRLLKVSLPDGNIGQREIIYHPGAVAVVPILPGNKIVLVKQYRKAAEKIMLEIPAGTLERGEKLLNCVHRELLEETGYKAKKIKKILHFYTAPGYTSEIIHIYKAEGLSFFGGKTDADEFIKTEILSKNELKKLYKTGKIVDSKTLIALMAVNLI